MTSISGKKLFLRKTLKKLGINYSNKIFGVFTFKHNQKFKYTKTSTLENFFKEKNIFIPGWGGGSGLPWYAGATLPT